MRRSLALRPSSESLEPVVLLSSASPLAAAAETGNIDAMKLPDAKPINLAPWASLATEVFNKNQIDLRLIGGGAFSAADKQATLKALKTDMHNANVPKVATGNLVLDTFFNFDDGAGTLMFKLTIKKKVYSVQLERLPSGPTTVFVGQTDPSVLVDAPPAEPVTGARVGAELERVLNEDNITLGPVNQLSIGTSLAAQLLALGFPSSVYNIQFELGPAQGGDNNDDVTFEMRATANETSVISQDITFAVLLRNDGTFSLNVVPAGQLAPEPYPVTNAQYIPYAGFTSSPFYFP
jgi:hypothetical protein